MATSSLLALIDDIATILDDVAVLSKVAAKKTAGVLGDDLALNAQQVSGVSAARELPVVWAVARGSLKNKAILVPTALAISAFIPWAVTPLLMLGGAYLCYEGVEKVAHKFLYSNAEDEEHHAELIDALSKPQDDIVALEKEKIKGAIRTDFILSAEIIVITLGTVATAAFGKQVAVLSAIAIIMTVGVYGIVAGIVKLDDSGLYLSKKTGLGLLGKFQRRFGALILKAAPYLMKTLSIVGTAAMFLLGGGIISHGVPAIHHCIESQAQNATELPVMVLALFPIIPSLVDFLIGFAVGAIVLAVVTALTRLRKLMRKPTG